MSNNIKTEDFSNVCSDYINQLQEKTAGYEKKIGWNRTFEKAPSDLAQCLEECEFQQLSTNMMRIYWNGPYALNTDFLDFFRWPDVVWMTPVVDIADGRLCIEVLLVTED